MWFYLRNAETLLICVYTRYLAYKYRHFWFVFILNLREILPPIFQQLKLPVPGFSTIEIICYHGTILTEEGCLNMNPAWKGLSEK
jgi:hypothetical protein